METAASNPRRSGSLLSMLLMVITLTVAAFELSERLMTYVRSEFGQEAQDRLETWQNLHDMASRAAVDRQLRLVNSFFNRVRFVSDIAHWGEEDYWATPVELLTTNGGDCEDFSIAKSC